MKSMSIGIPARSRSRSDAATGQRGFTLLEALIALALIVTFAATLGPYLFEARRIVRGSDGRVAAHALLRTLIEAPVARSNLAGLPRAGETGGLHWSTRAEPIAINPVPINAGDARGGTANWTPYRLVVTVSWAPGLSVAAETVRLLKAE
jgi:prepilin-type N-terminal cleavage/methylation domain-containing protein